jgi:hypothetical protein
MPHGAPRTRKFTITLTDEELAELHRAATESGLPTATWARRALRLLAVRPPRRGSAKK